MKDLTYFLLKPLPKSLKKKVYARIWQFYVDNLQNPVAFNPWERREGLAFLETIKDKIYDDFTPEEIERMRQLADLFTERGIRMIKMRFRF